MLKKLTEAAYAKINLCLDVTGRLENGYHEIDGVMQSVSLCDFVTVQIDPEEERGIILKASGDHGMPTDRSNLAYRAAETFLKETGIEAKVEIELEKRIPMAGGLAGGSSDAAAVLRALNALTGSKMSREQLCEIGATLGADVPFCICGGTLRTRGIGDILTPCAPMPDCAVVIARRGEGISTPWAYGRLDELYQSFAPEAIRPDSGLGDLLNALDEGSLEKICASVYNIFEPVAAECREEIALLRNAMLEGGAMVARMSGSGTAVFGIFENDGDAEKICKKLHEEGAEAFLCRPVSEEIS